MLRITIPASSEEYWDERKEEFITVSNGKEQMIQLEHSLVSISKWESKWKKAFLGKQAKTDEEMFDYIRCMTVTQNVDPSVYDRLTAENIREINAYIEDPMSATTINHLPSSEKGGKDTITSELIYYWMIAYNIPFECQKWHLSRLLKLIDICNVKNAPQKKMSKAEIMKQNAALNAARRAKLKTKG